MCLKHIILTCKYNKDIFIPQLNRKNNFRRGVKVAFFGRFWLVYHTSQVISVHFNANMRIPCDLLALLAWMASAFTMPAMNYPQKVSSSKK